MHDDGGKKPRQNNEIKNQNTFMENTPCLKIDIKAISTMFFHSDSHQFKIFMRSRYNTKVLSLA